MPFWTPDPTFYPSARMAMQAPAERLAFLVTLNPTLQGRPDALCVVDVDPGSPSYSQVVDTKPDPRQPRIVKVIEPKDVAERAGYSRLHTVHCAPDGIYVGALGQTDGEGPGGILVLDHDSFEVLGRW